MHRLGDEGHLPAVEARLLGRVVEKLLPRTKRVAACRGPEGGEKGSIKRDAGYILALPELVLKRARFHLIR